MSIFDRRRDPCEEPAPRLPLIKEPDYPRFCSVCGSGLAYECEPAGFDEKTGAPKFYRWAHCPKWTGGMHKILSPAYGVSAAFLNATFTKELYLFGSGYDRFYLDCRPAYDPALFIAPAPEPVKPKRAAK